MTDETYTFISDVKEKKSVARSGGKKGKSRRGCTLPSDNLSTKEKRQMNGDMVSICMDRPMSYTKFQSLSAEVQKEYLQNIIDKHGGNTSRIAYMFGIEESQVKKIRQSLGIISKYAFGNESIPWMEFLGSADFLKKPMTWETFKALDKFDQQEYLDFLYKEYSASTRAIARMFGIADTTIISYSKTHNLTLQCRKNGRQSNSDVLKWNEFVKTPENKDENPILSEEVPTENNNEHYEIPLQDAKAVLKNANASAIEDVCMTITVKSFDDIKKVLDTLPKVKNGNITFVFGTKSYAF